MLVSSVCLKLPSLHSSHTLSLSLKLTNLIINVSCTHSRTHAHIVSTCKPDTHHCDKYFRCCQIDVNTRPSVSPTLHSRVYLPWLSSVSADLSRVTFKSNFPSACGRYFVFTLRLLGHVAAEQSRVFSNEGNATS